MKCSVALEAPWQRGAWPAARVFGATRASRNAGLEPRLKSLRVAPGHAPLDVCHACRGATAPANDRTGSGAHHLRCQVFALPAMKPGHGRNRLSTFSAALATQAGCATVANRKIIGKAAAARTAPSRITLSIGRRRLASEAIDLGPRPFGRNDLETDRPKLIGKHDPFFRRRADHQVLQWRLASGVRAIRPDRGRVPSVATR